MDISCDICTQWFWELGETPIPPLCLEIVLRDSSRYFMQSVILKDEESKSMVVRIWDMRAFTEVDVEELKQKMNDRIITGKKPADVEHPKLDVANLRMHLDDLWYCVEWHNRFWPEELKGKICLLQEDS